MSDRTALEQVWRERLNVAKLRLEFARHFLKELERDRTAADILATDGHFAHRNAIDAENAAVEEYSRVLRIYTDLVVDGKMPDEHQWRGNPEWPIEE